MGTVIGYERLLKARHQQELENFQYALKLLLLECFAISDDGGVTEKPGITLGDVEANIIKLRSMVAGWEHYQLYKTELDEFVVWTSESARKVERAIFSA